AHLPKSLQIPDEGFAQPILIRNLMTHTAGFEDAVFAALFTHDPATLQPFDTYLATHRVHRVRPPGVVSVYSNYGASLAAAIVEQETGMRWEDYAEQQILRPLGMAHATYREPYPDAMVAKGFPAPLSPAETARVSTGFTYTAARYAPQAWEYVATPPIGALSASANDMSSYMRALLDPARMQQAGVLSVAAALDMRQPLFRDIPGFGAWLHGFYEMPAPDGETAFGHDGDLMYQHAMMAIYPKAGLAIFVAVNTPTGMAFRGQLVREIVAKFVGTKPLPPRAAMSPAQAGRYAGLYQPLRRAYFRTERAFYDTIPITVEAAKNGDLLITGNKTVRYYYIGHDVFEDSDGVNRVSFVSAGGNMRLYSQIPGGPADRVSFFQTLGWLALILGLTAAVALVRTLGGAWRLIRGRESAILLAVDAAALIWFAGAALFGMAIGPWLADQAQAVYFYPGPFLPFACWLFLAATIATAVAIVAILATRPRDWPGLRWMGVIVTVPVFAICAVTMLHMGLLGYSGW
ncbi:MAG: serine hydrolase domain-containing protein, partial [Rhizomicrobium sp.]